MYGGPIEVFVTSTDIIYISEVEKICTLAAYKPSVHVASTVPNNTNEPISLSTNEGNTINTSSYDNTNSTNLETNATSAHINTTTTLMSSASHLLPPESSTEQLVEDHLNKIIESRSRSIKHIYQRLGTKATTTEASFFDPLVNPPPKVTLTPWECALVICIPLRLGEFHINNMYIDVSIYIYYFIVTTLF